MTQHNITASLSARFDGRLRSVAGVLVGDAPPVVFPDADLADRVQQARDAWVAAVEAGYTVRGLIVAPDVAGEIGPGLQERGFAMKTVGGQATFTRWEERPGLRTWRKFGGVQVLCQQVTRTAPAAEPVNFAAQRQLRDYQSQAIGQCEAHWAAGKKAVLLVSVTGSGKTVTFTEIARRWVDNGGSVLAIAHKRELIHQARNHMIRAGLPPAQVGMLMDGFVPEPGQHVIVSTIQSAHKVAATQGERPLLVIIDEAHHSAADGYRNVLARLNPARILGVTATPTRGDGRGLGDDYQVMVNALTYEEGFARGYLVRPRYFVASKPDLKDLRMKGGDYHPDDLERLMLKPRLVGDVVDHIRRLAHDRQGIVFAAGVKHSQALAESISAAGFPAAHIDGNTPKEEREEIVAQFREGQIQFLCNVDIATEGFDVPDVGAVIIARPTKSVIRWIQMAGRGLRPGGEHPDCLVIDHGGTWHVLGPVEGFVTWTLETTKGINTTRQTKPRSDAPVERDCRCGASWVGGAKCPSCGAVGNSPRAQAQNVAALEADLVEANSRLDPRLLAKRQKAAMTDEERMHLYWQMIHTALARGNKAGQAYWMYKEMFGTGPNQTWGHRSEPATPENAARIKKHLQDRAAQKRIAAAAIKKKEAAGQADAAQEFAALGTGVSAPMPVGRHRRPPPRG